LILRLAGANDNESIQMYLFYDEFSEEIIKKQYQMSSGIKEIFLETAVF